MYADTVQMAPLAREWTAGFLLEGVALAVV
jgi:hypothetical protein